MSVKSICLLAALVAAPILAVAQAAEVPAQQYHADFESADQLTAWHPWANVHQPKIEAASPGYESPTCLRVTVPGSDWCTAILDFPTPIRVTERTVLRFKMRTAPGMLEGLNVRNATEGAEYLLKFPMPGGGWTLVQQYLKSSLYKRFGKADVPRDGVVGDEISSIQIAYLGTELCVDDFEIFEATSALPELPSEHLLPQGSYQPRRYPCLETVFPYGVITTVAAGNAANAAIFGQTSDERFEDDLLDLKRHGMNAISNFCDDGRVAWRLGLMERYGLYLVETALANADLRGAKPDNPHLRMVAQNRDHPHLLAWYGRDEPNDCLAYLENKRALMSADPNHPVASAFNHMHVARLLGPYMELMMLDPYSVFNPERTVDALAFHADLVRTAREYCQGRSVWMIPQAFSWRHRATCTMRMPDPSEATFDVFNTIGAGASGFLFFIYNDTCTYLDNQFRGEEFDDTLVDPWGNAHPTYEALSELGRSIVPAMPALLNATEPPRVQVEYPKDKLTLGQLRNASGEFLVFASTDLAGPSRTPAQVGLQPGEELWDLLTLRQVPVREGTCELDLPPGGGAILMVGTAQSWGAVRKGIVRRRLEQESERLEVECRVLKAQGLDVAAIEQALRQTGPTAPALRAARKALERLESGHEACAAMKTQLGLAQHRFGAIHRLIRPVVATVDGTQDADWLAALTQLKALSARYFALRREFKSGNFAGGESLPALIAEQEALADQIAALAKR